MSVALPNTASPVEKVIPEFPSDFEKKSTLEDFQFIKVIGTGTFFDMKIAKVQLKKLECLY